MTIRVVMNLTRGAVIVAADGRSIGARETFTFDDATIGAETLDLIRAHVDARRLAPIGELPDDPGPTDPPPTEEPTDPTTPTTPVVFPVTSVAGKKGDVALVKGDVGLNNVNNTSDANKPISNSTASALAGKAPLDHTHTLQSIGGLGAALEAKLDASRLIIDSTGPVRPVLAVDGNGPDVNGNVVTLGAASLAPGAPTTLTYTLTEEGALLEWTPPVSIGGSPIIGYKVGRFGYDKTGAGPYVSDLLSENDRTALIPSLIPGATYPGVWVAAANDFGLGPKRTVDVYVLDAGPVGNIFTSDVYDAGKDISKLAIDEAGLTITSTTAWKSAGDSSAEMVVGNGANASSGVRPASAYAVIVGHTYKFSVDVQNVSITNRFRLTAKWLKDDGSTLSVTSNTAVNITPGTVQRLELTATAPAGAVSAHFVLRPADTGQTVTIGTRFRTDAWALVDVTAPTTPQPEPTPVDQPVTVPTGNLVSAAVYDTGSDITKVSPRGTAGGTILTSSTDWRYVGTSSAKVTFTSTSSAGSGLLVPDFFPVTDGIYYKASARVRNGNMDLKFIITLNWFDANKVAIPGSPTGNPTTIAVGTDATLSTEVTAPPKAAFCQFYIKSDTTKRPPTDGVYYVDALSLEQTSTTAKVDTYQYVIADRKPAAALFTSSSSYWKIDVTNAPLHPDSATLVNALVTNEILPNYSGITVFNTNQYNSTNYVVSKDHPRINIGFCDAQRKGYTPGELYSNAGVYKMFMGVPVPRGAVNGGGGDGHITIHCPETDQLWEFWQFQEDRQQDNGYGGVQPAAAAAGDFGYKTSAQVNKDWRGFSATWGGRIDNVSQNPGVFPGATGTSATGLSYADGTISFQDLEKARTTGIFDHALALSIVAPRKSLFSWPAKRTDGYDVSGRASTTQLPEGLRMKMDPTVDFSSLNLHWIAKAVGRTAQKWGWIITDKSGGVEVEGESASAITRRGGTNPWLTYLGSTPDYNVMKNFPWTKAQALPLDYLKP